MKRLPVALTFFLMLSVRAFASENDSDFSLTLHITAVHMEQGQAGVSGSGRTDSDGNYSSSVSGGESYTWHLYTVQIDGDKKTYELSTPRMHYKGGTGLAAVTLGWSVVVTERRNYWLQIGDYRGHWNKDGTLEIQFTDPKGKLVHQTFHVEAEDTTPEPTPTPTPPTSSNSAAATMANLTVESNISGADIEIDGAFVGNTPSTVALAPGSHQIVVKKEGFTNWSRTLNVTGGTVHLSAELEHQ